MSSGCACVGSVVERIIHITILFLAKEIRWKSLANHKKETHKIT